MISTFLVTWPSNKKIDIADQGNSSTQIGQGINWLYYSTPGRASKKISYFSLESAVVSRPAKEGQSSKFQMHTHIN